MDDCITNIQNLFDEEIADGMSVSVLFENIKPIRLLMPSPSIQSFILVALFHASKSALFPACIPPRTDARHTKKEGHLLGCPSFFLCLFLDLLRRHWNRHWYGDLFVFGESLAEVGLDGGGG